MSKRLNGSIVNYTPRQPHTHSRRDSSRPCENLFFLFYLILFFGRKFVHFPPAGERWTFPFISRVTRYTSKRKRKSNVSIRCISATLCDASISKNILHLELHQCANDSSWSNNNDPVSMTSVIIFRFRDCCRGTKGLRPPPLFFLFLFFCFRPSSVAILPSHRRLCTAVCQKHWRYMPAPTVTRSGTFPCVAESRWWIAGAKGLGLDVVVIERVCLRILKRIDV